MISNEEYIGQLHAEADALAAERNDFRAILIKVRGTLGTPDDVDVVAWAAQVAADAAKWRTVPWDAIASAMLGWELHGDIDDEMADITAWYDNSKPEEVQV